MKSIWPKWVNSSCAEFLGFAMYGEKTPYIVSFVFHTVIKPLYDLKCYLRNRFIDEIHLIRLNVKKGQYHDLDHRLELSFVSLARDYLYKELGHIDEFRKDNPEYITKTNYSELDMIEMINLKDPDYSVFFYKGFRVHFCDSESYIDLMIWFLENESKIIDFWKFNHTIYEENHKKYFDMEKEFQKELEEKMIQFIKIRGHLWT